MIIVSAAVPRAADLHRLLEATPEAERRHVVDDLRGRALAQRADMIDEFDMASATGRKRSKAAVPPPMSNPALPASTRSGPPEIGASSAAPPASPMAPAGRRKVSGLAVLVSTISCHQVAAHQLPDDPVHRRIVADDSSTMSDAAAISATLACQTMQRSRARSAAIPLLVQCGDANSRLTRRSAIARPMRPGPTMPDARCASIRSL